MSTTALSDYLEAAGGDAAEAAALEHALEGRTGEAAREALAARARARGHDVAAADIAALEAALAHGEGPIEDAALEGVAGGGGFFQGAHDWLNKLVKGINISQGMG